MSEFLKKILLLTSRYLPNPSANGINSKYIIDELKRRGHHVTCISVKAGNESSYEVIEGTPIYRVTPSFYSKVLFKESILKQNKIRKVGFKALHFLRKIKLGLLLFNFPNFDLSQTRKVYSLLKKLHDNENYDCIIGVFKPFSNIGALKKFKKNYPNTLCGGYYLDLINSSQRPSYISQKIYNELCYKGDIDVFEKLDFILMAKGGREIYTNSIYDKFAKKIEYIDFPTFLSTSDYSNKNNSEEIGGDIQVIVLTYAGTLDKNYRNPNYLLRILESASKELGNIKLNIYGGNNCEDIINEFNIGNGLEIINHGFMSHETVIKAMSESDMLVNISNKLQNAVPSKIFELFSMGKPIINLIFDENDITNEYFLKYPSVGSIEVWKDFDEQVIEIVKYIKKEKGCIYENLQIRQRYIENTPEYTVDIIEKQMEIET